MHYFEYRDNRLFCDDLSVEEIAEEIGTPFYLYSGRTLLRHIESFHQAFGDVDHLTCYSVKANANLALLHVLAERGMGADIVSGGELYQARKAGFSGDRIVYSGVGKTEEEIRYALEEGILAFNVESIPELETIDQMARQMKRRAPIALRINPDINPKTHPYISTGLRQNKFGISHVVAVDVYKLAAEKENLEIVGIDAHIGSQITEVGPFVKSAEKLAALVKALNDEGITLKHVDIGGGLGIRYNDEEPPEPAEWADAIMPILREMGCRIVLEPGRAMIGNVGILVTQVLYVKQNEEKTFVIVDAGMNDLVRPAMYGSYHRIQPVVKSEERTMVADVVGPICESGDFLAKEREISVVGSGELLAVMSAGAYGASMSSNYNARPRPPEVLVTDGAFHVVRERETYEDLIRGERMVQRM